MKTGFCGAAAVLLLLAACGTNTEQRSATGAGTGAVAGALVGGPVGAVVGAAVGGAGSSQLNEGVDKKAADAIDKAQGDKTSGAGTSGSSGAGKTLAADEVRKHLQHDGYRNVRDLRIEGDAYSATATKGGKSYKLQVDPQTGNVRSRQAA
jgi:peptidase YpeB-like protein